MHATLKFKCLIKIEGSIYLPPANYFVRNENSARINYLLGDKRKCINLTSRIELAEMLLKIKPEIIDGYTIENGELKMYKNTLITVLGKKSAPVQHTWPTPVRWEDINLTDVQVQTLAAIHEYELSGQTMGIVVKMAKDFLKAA